VVGTAEGLIIGELDGDKVGAKLESIEFEGEELGM